MLVLLPEERAAVQLEPLPNGGTYWRQILSRLKGATSADAAWVTQYDVSARSGRILSAVNVPAEFMVAYNGGLSHDDPWLQHEYFFHDVCALVPGRDVVSDEVLESSTFYVKWLAPQKLFHHLFGVISRSASTLTVICLARGRSKKAFDETASTILSATLPAAAAAWRLEHLLQAARSETQAVWRAMDLMKFGVLLVNAGGRVIGVNRLGRELIDARDGIGLNDGYLVALRYQDQIQLQTALQQVPATTSGVPAIRALAFPRNGKTGPLHLVLAAISDPRGAGSPEPALVCIFISDRERREPVSVSMLRELFGLTRVEAEVASLLSEGYALEEVASRLHASKHTVRTYLKSIFQKTETHRQVSLVRLLLNGVGVVRNMDVET